MTSEEFPRPISFDEIRADDTIRQSFDRDGVRTERTFVVAAGNSLARFVEVANGDRFHAAPGVEWTLLSRPVKRGPAWDAAPGSLWTYTDAISGMVYARMFNPPRFIGLVSGAIFPAVSSTDFDIDSLVPFQSPSVDAERERLRGNVIEAAQNYIGIAELGNFTGGVMPLDVAVRALRDHEAKS